MIYHKNNAFSLHWRKMSESKNDHYMCCVVERFYKNNLIFRIYGPFSRSDIQLAQEFVKSEQEKSQNTYFEIFNMLDILNPKKL